MTVMLRLDPAHPALWVDGDRLQFGTDPVLVIETPAPWQERLLAELVRGLPESGLRVWAGVQRVDAAAVRAFVRDLGALVLRIDADRRRSSLRVVVECPRGALRAALTLAVDAALRATGAAVHVQEWGADVPPDADDAHPADVVVLLADHVLEPRRAGVRAALDIPHIPVIATGAGIDVGPILVPGDSACAACLDLQRRDASPHWPVLAAQLLGARPVAPGAALAHEAAAAVVRLLDGGDTGCRISLSDGAPPLREGALPPHDECACRAPQGNATAPVPISRRIAPTTVTRLAVPA